MINVLFDSQFDLGSGAARLTYTCLAETDIQEELSLAYVRAVASSVGYSVEEVRKDRDSIDLRICAKGKLADDVNLESPILSVQLKSSYAIEMVAEKLSFPLKLKNYNDLRRTKVQMPAILVVLVLPRERERWISWTPEQLELRHCAFWHSLRGSPETTNSTTCSIAIPREQTFTPQTLQDLMLKVAREQVIL